jgi:hypothetical protein
MQETAERSIKQVNGVEFAITCVGCVTIDQIRNWQIFNHLSASVS